MLNDTPVVKRGHVSNNLHKRIANLVAAARFKYKSFIKYGEISAVSAII